MLIQGAAASHLHWGERLLAHLERTFDVVTYDHRGVGDSQPIEDMFTITDLAHDAVGILDELGWERAAVFGVSLGSAVAVEMALIHPDRPSHLILGCPPDASAAAPLRHPALSTLGRPIVRGDALATARNLFRLGVSDASLADDEAWSEYARAALPAPSNPRTTVLQADALARYSVEGRLATLDVPTLVIHGDADRIIGLDAGLRLASKIEGARARIVSAGHFFWLEDPEGTATLISRFCSDQPEAGAQVPASARAGAGEGNP